MWRSILGAQRDRRPNVAKKNDPNLPRFVAFRGS